MTFCFHQKILSDADEFGASFTNKIFIRFISGKLSGLIEVKRSKDYCFFLMLLNLFNISKKMLAFYI